MLASPSFQRGRSKGERTSYRPSRRYAFWRCDRRTGNRKQVNQKVAETVAAVDAHRGCDGTVRAIAIFLGLEEIEVRETAVAAGRSKWLAPAWFACVRKLVAEHLDPSLPADSLGAFLAAKSTAVLDPSFVAKQVASCAARDEPAPCLRQMLDPAAIAEVLRAILSLPLAPPKFGRPGGVPFGDVILILLEHMAAAVVRHHQHLLETFYKFDEGDGGLDADEFELLMRWTTGPVRLGDQSSVELHGYIEALADADAEAF